MQYNHNVKAKGFSGVVTITAPKYMQRMQYLKDCSFEVGPDGNITINSGNIDSIMKMWEIAKKHIVKIDITKTEVELKYSTPDELEYDGDCDELINEICNLIMTGVKMGKR